MPSSEQPTARRGDAVSCGQPSYLHEHATTAFTLRHVDGHVFVYHPYEENAGRGDVAILSVTSISRTERTDVLR
jgi:hypothetical protein